MENKLELNIIWKTNDITKIDIKQLEEKDILTFYFDEKNSSSFKKIFKSIDVNKRVSNLFKWGLIGILIQGCVLYLLSNLNVNEGIGSVLLISIFFTIIGVMTIPFNNFKEISLKNYKEICVNKIYKKNMFGFSRVLMDMDYPVRINRIVFKQSGDKVFITFRENIGDVVPLGSPILVVDFKNEFQLKGIEDMLVDFVNNVNHEIKIEKIYSNPK